MGLSCKSIGKMKKALKKVENEQLKAAKEAKKLTKKEKKSVKKQVYFMVNVGAIVAYQMACNVATQNALRLQ